MLTQSINGTRDTPVAAIIPGHLNLVDQMMTMRKCDVVIGPHGAGLTNVIWAKPDAALLFFPLYSETPESSYYCHLAATQNREAVLSHSLRSTRNGNYTLDATIKSIPEIVGHLQELL